MDKDFSPSSGFTLIEVLLALLLLAVGALAVINMQTRALQNAQIAYTHSIAAVVAMDAAEQLWAVHALDAEDCSVNGELDGADGIIRQVEDRWNNASPQHDYSLQIEHMDDPEQECSFKITITSNKVPDEDGELTFSLTLPLPEDLYDEPES